jgi:hypothetical protein
VYTSAAFSPASLLCESALARACSPPNTCLFSLQASRLFHIAYGPLWSHILSCYIVDSVQWQRESPAPSKAGLGSFETGATWEGRGFSRRLRGALAFPTASCSSSWQLVSRVSSVLMWLSLSASTRLRWPTSLSTDGNSNFQMFDVQIVAFSGVEAYLACAAVACVEFLGMLVKH